MNNNNLNNEIFEVMLRNAVLEQFSNEYQNVLARSETVDIQEYSVELKKTMQRIFTKEKLQAVSRKFFSISRRVAMVLLVLMAVTIALFTTVEAFRTQVYNFLFNLKDNYSTINLVASDIKIDNIIPDNWDGAYVAAYLPEGYELATFKYNSSYLICEYDYKNNYIILKQKKIGESTQTVNSDNAEIIDLGEVNGQLFFNNECTTLFWNDNGMRFELVTNEKKEIIISIAKNLKYIKKV